MQSVIVDSVLWQGRRGGALFNAISTDGTCYRIVAGPEVMPRPPVVGEAWDIEGVMRRHAVHGQQVEARKAMLRAPSGRFIVRVISSSRSFPGIGTARAQALWDSFGESIYTLLAAGFPDPFASLLGPQLALVLINGWAEMANEVQVYQWLDEHGLPVWLARKLLAIYGPETVVKLEENPFRILAFTSWPQAAMLGRVMGVADDDWRRLVAAADAVSYKRLAFAHTWSSLEGFVEELEKLLGGGKERAQEAARLALDVFALVKTGDGVQGVGPGAMERYIASRVNAMLHGDFEAAQMTLRQEPTVASLTKIFAEFTARTGLDLNPGQKDAVRLAVSCPLVCIKGGAGVGKTATLCAVHVAAEMLGFGGVIQMALSGRAAKRMTEATGGRAYTIAAFLQGVDTGQIRLEGECILVVDEASMLDLTHCYRIMRRMPPGTKLLLVGDAAQLPPIGFGLTFHLLADHPAIPTVELTEIHRQAAATGIPQFSVAIRNGKVPELAAYAGLADGVSFIDATANQVAEHLREVVNCLGGFGACQIIGAVKSGSAGVHTINRYFHDLLPSSRCQRNGFAELEPVLWTANDYQRGLFNGSLGRVIDAKAGLKVEFDGALHDFGDADVQDMEHAYAISTHKSQGSQFERVVVPVFPSRILDRTLLYTAVTRAQKQVVLVGDRGVFEMAVANAPLSSRRQTGMEYHLGLLHEDSETLPAGNPTM